MNKFDLKNTLSSMVCLIDTREHENEKAKKRYQALGIPYRKQNLFAGDYSAVFTLPTGEEFSMEHICCIERKASLGELCGNFCQNRARFVREFERIKEADAKVYIIIEGGGDWEAIYNHRYNSQMLPQTLIASLTAWMARYNAHVLFCHAETFPKLCREILYREAKEILTNMEVDT